MKNYDIQNEIITQAKYWGIVLSSDLIYLLILFQVASAFRERAYTPIGNLTVVLVFVLGFYWIVPNPGNSQKRNYQRLLLILSKNRSTYHPLAFFDFEQTEELSDVFLNETEWEEEMFQERSEIR